MQQIINIITRFLNMLIKAFSPKREYISDSKLLNNSPEQATNQLKSHSENKIKLENLFDYHTAIMFPDFVGDGLNGVTLREFQGGYDSYFFYIEDYENYTEIVDGAYIIKGYENEVEIGNWLVLLEVIGTKNELKAIVCHYMSEVAIVHEIESKGPDRLNQTTCYYKFLTK